MTPLPTHDFTRQLSRWVALRTGICGLLLVALLGCSSTGSQRISETAAREVRGTWITTTANTALSTPANTAKTMQRLREIGLNTVYVEVWKNGYTQFPSEVLFKAIGERERPKGMQQDPSDAALSGTKEKPSRDLLQEMLIEAHRNGLITVAWFEYGFMAAHKDTMPLLRTKRPELLSRDINGNEVAPNGFVWLNPLHPDARKLLLDLVLEAVDKYDLDGIQLDDRIVWPYITMGYDDYTKQVYAKEHNGKLPPADHKDPQWMRWRSEKINEYSKLFVQEVRAKRPGLLISLSPAVYPWSWENYLLELPQWAAWTEKDKSPSASDAAKKFTPRWDEFIPQAYRFSYEAFEKTWLEQNEHMKKLGTPNRTKDLVAGIRIVGDGKDSSWEQLRDSINLTRKLGNGGHVLWFSRGVLDVYPKELTQFYAESDQGKPAISPHFPAGWRKSSIPLFRSTRLNQNLQGRSEWTHPDIPRGTYRMIGSRTGNIGKQWEYIQDQNLDRLSNTGNRVYFYLDNHYTDVELVLDRRDDMMRMRQPSE